ncbi:MAG TPA: Nramp family divalent metal transporter [Gemmatimonadales bacterium]|nr:Nramp family divalent metal transporter [Gemmatimonadales bacterium]
MTVPTAPEARSGLDPWVKTDLPAPPQPRGFQWIGVVGPGVIVLGVSIGSGEFLLGPAAFVRHGFALLWITLVAVFLQTVFNTEIMRYTVATGEPAFTGFMRTGRSARAWAWVYAVLYFLQNGWPAWAGTAAGAIYFLVWRRLPAGEDFGTVNLIATGTFLLCVAILLVGRRIERTLEILNWVLVTCILGGLLVLALWLVPGATWLAGIAGFAGYDLGAGRFEFIPEGADFILLGALAGYSGCGGMGNIVLGNWARDKGYGMGAKAGYIPAAVGGKKVPLAATGFTFDPDAPAMERWRGWWRVLRADQWGVFFSGSMIGMLFPAILYVTFLEAGSDIRGLGIAGALASAIGRTAGPVLAGAIAFTGAWILFKTQLDILEGMVRALTDMLWTGSRRIRAWRGGDVRVVYYGVLGVVVLWGIVALRLVQPIALLQLGANMASIVFVLASLHLLYVNTRLLPPAVRPPLWRRVCLVLMAIFYGAFAGMSIRALLT